MATVLVIDDDETIRLILKETLVREGHEVFEAEDGKVAEKMLSDVSVDVIITDILMPEMDGLEVTNFIKNNYPHIKVIVISGGGSVNAVNYLETVKLLGISHILRKPLEPQEILKSVREVLEQ